MERLTERELNSVENVSYCKCFFKDCDGNCQRCELQYEADMKLKHYEDLEEQNLLIKLPCKVGDALYMPWEYDWDVGVAIITVKKIVIDLDDKFLVETDLYSDSKDFLEEYNYGIFSFSDFGKTVFLTKEETERKLKEMQNG